MAHPQQQFFVGAVRQLMPDYFSDKSVVEIGSLNINGTLDMAGGGGAAARPAARSGVAAPCDTRCGADRVCRERLCRRQDG